MVDSGKLGLQMLERTTKCVLSPNGLGAIVRKLYPNVIQEIGKNRLTEINCAQFCFTGQLAKKHTAKHWKTICEQICETLIFHEDYEFEPLVSYFICEKFARPR